jgi:hypothetical protein
MSKLTPGQIALMDFFGAAVLGTMSRMTPTARSSFVDHLAELAGVTLISKETAASNRRRDRSHGPRLAGQ